MCRLFISTDPAQYESRTRSVRHRGKPVVTIWGFGFTSRTNTPADAHSARR